MPVKDWTNIESQSQIRKGVHGNKRQRIVLIKINKIIDKGTIVDRVAMLDKCIIVLCPATLFKQGEKRERKTKKKKRTNKDLLTSQTFFKKKSPRYSITQAQ